MAEGICNMAKPSEPKLQRERNIRSIWYVLFELRHYKAVKSIFLYHAHPIGFIACYAFAFGTYPCVPKFRLGRRELNLHVYSWHDVFAIFFRNNYLAFGHETNVVDCGSSNIGIFAAFVGAPAHKLVREQS